MLAFIRTAITMKLLRVRTYQKRIGKPKKKTSKISNSRYGTVKRENKYFREVLALKKTILNWKELYDTNITSDEERFLSLTRIDVIGNHLCNKYSWAIPDSRSLNIIKSFSPIVEIGCGNGYWAYLLRKLEVDIIAVDKVVDDSTAWTNIVKGNPKILQQDNCKNRNLFLCYPDEDRSMAEKCLKYFVGDIILHVGEMIHTGGTNSGQPQIPFGRTTSADFQIKLAENFHCLLVAEIPRFPFSNDTISVWKRTNFVAGLNFNSVDSPSDSENASNYPTNAMDNLNLWKSIPANERLSINLASPSLQHLL